MAILDGPGFHVDTAALDEAATGIKRSVDDQNNFELRGLCGDTELYGHAGVHDALMDFCVRWSDGLDVLTDDAGTIGGALSSAAKAYGSIDEDVAKTLKSDPLMQEPGSG